MFIASFVNSFITVLIVNTVRYTFFLWLCILGLEMNMLCIKVIKQQNIDADVIDVMAASLPLVAFELSVSGTTSITSTCHLQIGIMTMNPAIMV